MPLPFPAFLCKFFLTGHLPFLEERKNMRIISIAQATRNYPRFVAEKREGRFKGQYPSPEIRHVPSLRRQWDRGGFGTGIRLIEIEAETAGELIQKIRTQGLNPHDDFEFFMIRSPRSPRELIPTQRLFAMTSNGLPQ
jgi:hypothetical protein